jgi:hypothetical protein
LCRRTHAGGLEQSPHVARAGDQGVGGDDGDVQPGDVAQILHQASLKILRTTTAPTGTPSTTMG